MTDSYSKEKRSHIMSMIKSKNTKPEIIVRKYLFSKGFRYRINVRRLPGSPDIVLRKYKTVIFVNGCFWHGHENCPEFRPPRTRVEWWTAKLNRNKARDEEVRKSLRSMGWNTMVVWECQLKPKKRQDTLDRIVALLETNYVETTYRVSFRKPYDYSATGEDFSRVAEDASGDYHSMDD